MPINPRNATRRTLRFTTLDDVLVDAETVTAGPHHTTGNWTAAQIVHHVATLMRVANHGGGPRLPRPVRLVGRVLKLAGVHRRPLKPGIKMPGSVKKHFLGPPDLPLADALALLREQVATANATPMPHPSPLFGRLEPDVWVEVHCRHAELHFSFVHPGEPRPHPKPNLGVPPKEPRTK